MRDRGTDHPLAALLPPLVLVAVPVALFWAVVSQRGSFYYGDLLRIYYPLKVALSNALAQGQLPLWTPDIMAGYPLHGEGEGGFLYPVGLFLSLALSPLSALNWQIVLHVIIAGLGMYIFARVMGLDGISAGFGGLAYMLSGFIVAHLNHLSILSAAAWLPLLFALAELMLRQRRTGLYASLLGLLLGLQFSAGHAQVSFMTVLALGLYVLFGGVLEVLDGQGLGRLGKLLVIYVLAVVLGAGLAAPQLLPSLELTGESVRAGGLTGAFFTSFSFPPPYMISFLAPFIAGDPLGSTSPAAAVEWCGYIGILPLVVAVYAVAFRRDRQTVFFLILGVLALVLSFGQYNPLYERLASVPVFNFFRVPARFLFLYNFAVASLFALGMHTLLYPRLPVARELPRLVPVLLGAPPVLLWGLLLNSAAQLDQMLTLWLALPLLLIAGVLILVAARGRLLLGTRAFVVLTALVLGLDLYAFANVFNLTFNAVVPRNEVAEAPRSLSVFAEETEPYRVYTHQRIVPVAVGVRESLFPNYSLAAGVPSLSGYLPLSLSVYSEYEEYLAEHARLVDIANVKYVLVPQSVSDDAETERDNLTLPFAPAVVGQRVEFAPTTVSAVEVASFLSRSVDLPNDEVVAEIVVSDGRTSQVIPLRVGADTAEWAYERSDVRAAIKHSRPTSVREWLAESGAPPEEHPGYTYIARLPLEQPMQATSIEVRLRHPRAFLNVESVKLIDQGDRATSLAQLTGKSEFELVYRNDAVAVYRNLDALPRAYVVHEAREAANTEEVWQQLLAPEFDPQTAVVLGPQRQAGLLDWLLSLSPFAAQPQGELAAGAPAGNDAAQIVEMQNQAVTVRADLTQPGYLVLADTYYPGWRVYVDGTEASLLRANGLFRAVALPEGTHEVRMVYEPSVFTLGWVVTLLSIVGLVALAVVPAFSTTSRVSGWSRSSI